MIMQDLVTTTGMIIKTVPIGEYDRRVVILTKERGKITAFVRGARKQNSRFVAATNLFCFGKFLLYPGKNAYSLSDAEIQNYFEDLHNDFEGAYYGMYFLEIAEYYGRENNDDRELLKLLYQSLRALTVPALDKKLVRSIFEIKAVVVNGEFPGIPSDHDYLASTKYAVQYVTESSIEKLYTFTLSEECFREFRQIADLTCKKCFDRKFKSLEILKDLP